MAFEALLAEYEKRRAKALAMGGAEKLARRKTAGALNARERIELLFDPGTFLESGLFGASGVYPEEAEETQTDGKIAGYGRIDGRDVAAVVNDFTVKGASTSATNSKKVAHMKRTATERGMPLVIIGESTGARLPDAMGSRGMGQLLGNDTDAVPPHARDADGDGRARPLLRLLDLARLPLRFRGDAEGRDRWRCRARGWCRWRWTRRWTSRSWAAGGCTPT